MGFPSSVINDNKRIEVNIIGAVETDDQPYVAVTADSPDVRIHGWFADNDLEHFAVNVLKALGSNK